MLLFVNVHTTARWNDRVVVQNRVASEIMSLDVVHVDTPIHSGHLINISYVVEQVGVLSDKLFVGLEIDHVDLQLATYDKSREPRMIYINKQRELSIHIHTRKMQSSIAYGA